MESKWKVTKKKAIPKITMKNRDQKLGMPPWPPSSADPGLVSRENWNHRHLIERDPEIAASSTVRRYFYLGMFSGTII